MASEEHLSALAARSILISSSSDTSKRITKKDLQVCLNETFEEIIPISRCRWLVVLPDAEG